MKPAREKMKEMDQEDNIRTVSYTHLRAHETR